MTGDVPGVTSRPAGTPAGPPPSVADVDLRAPDGHPLAATHYRSDGVRCVVIASATAVPRRHYRHLAATLVAAGWDVVTLDYRGIGGSRLAHPRSTPHIRYGDWGRQDLGTAVAWAAARMPTWFVGHSFGGNALAMLPDPGMVRGAITMGSGGGWTGFMPLAEAVRVEFLWRVAWPLSRTLLGYVPMSRLGMGEDLPVGVFADWRHWCSRPRYFHDLPDAYSQGFSADCRRVTCPIMAVNATDDRWVPPAARNALLGGFVNAAVERVDLAPADLGLAAIGHMGYSTPQVGAELWPRLTHRLERWWQGTGGTGGPAV